MKHRRFLRFSLLAALALPALAVAHPGHGPDAGFALGFSHPFSGADHVALLIGAGLLVRKLGVSGSLSMLGGLLTLLVAGHADWIAPGAEGWGFLAGFLVASATLIGAGFGAVGIYRRVTTASARGSRT